MSSNKNWHELKKLTVPFSSYDLLLPTRIKELKIVLHKIYY